MSREPPFREPKMSTLASTRRDKYVCLPRGASGGKGRARISAWFMARPIPSRTKTNVVRGLWAGDTDLWSAHFVENQLEGFREVELGIEDLIRCTRRRKDC